MSWRTNRQNRRHFRVKPGSLDPRIFSLDKGLRARMEVVWYDGRTEIDYGTATTPTVIYMNRNEANPTLRLEHEIGHVVQDRMGSELQVAWVEEWSKQNTYEGFQLPSGLVDLRDRQYLGHNHEEFFAEMFAARSLGWQKTRFLQDPAKLYPTLWAMMDQIWSDANVA